MIRHHPLLLASALLCAGLAPSLARAQTPAPAPAASKLEITELANGFAVAPEVQFTKVNHRSATLAGGSVGWTFDHTLFVGAAGYWLANRHDDFSMQHGGALVRWTIGGHRPLAVSPGVFLGIGDATLSRRYGDLFGSVRMSQMMDPRFRTTRDVRFGQPITANTPVRVSDTYLVAEPRLNAVWAVTPWMRLDAGVTYRFIGASELLGHELRGPAGTVAIQFGR